MSDPRVTDATIAELRALRSLIDDELKARKTRLQKELALLADVRPARARRSDAGRPRQRTTRVESSVATPDQDELFDEQRRDDFERETAGRINPHE